MAPYCQEAKMKSIRHIQQVRRDAEMQETNNRQARTGLILPWVLQITSVTSL